MPQDTSALTVSNSLSFLELLTVSTSTADRPMARSNPHVRVTRRADVVSEIQTIFDGIYNKIQNHLKTVNDEDDRVPSVLTVSPAKNCLSSRCRADN